MEKHQVETEFQQKYGNMGELTCPTDCTDGSVWEEGHVPQAWKDANIVTIYKKGDRTECGNYRGISLLSAAGKIFARILLNRLSGHITPEVVPETQCVFRSNRKYSRHDLLPTTTPGKMHRAGSTSVYCVCRLQRRHSTPLGGLGYGSY